MSALGSTSHTCRPMFEHVAQRRFSSIAKQFFPDNTNELPMALHCNQGVITGSAALYVLMGRFYEKPRDLNIIVTQGKLTEMEEWLNSVGYEETNNEEVHVGLSLFILDFKIFWAQSNIITLAESMGPDIMEIIIHSPTTTDMTFITAGGVATLYPNWTLNDANVISPTGEWEQHGGGKIGSVNAGRGNIYKDNAFMNEACGPVCPGLWRNVRTDTNLMVVDWDWRYSARGHAVTTGSLQNSVQPLGKRGCLHQCTTFAIERGTSHATTQHSDPDAKGCYTPPRAQNL
ncbi:hypothetical protein BJ138DRAFT_1120160 [Hygrophoropsis aurantiaca]|uniref:Uncharacterized protein n=1 Tax=Hygrophoropsis aurantiaca TaxID=72124 RepID=A0ACB7ZSK2_9AGAM|nr:hypothetical protein BJ138DRAFT_1120160 [Hygrophoropsis aurantiaca]